ncbi:hypothetical protein A5733_04300 [Mycobacterium sp. NS-7484]|uniref:hypothetical protein n=1 Tax=Mycobacterium sp. NS-7484 TaxID=1834161 RepID=UPI00096F8CA8|nr:hypothetical protein [Mycobacterium sp. NS-7484]OMC00338.1 hypothetical protein A5733_04300 [Mycobacterium sp. NS-7484]
MTTELDLIANGAELATASTPGTTAAAMDMLRGHAEMMNAAHQLATAMVGTQMVPAVYRGKPDDAAAAILYGAELGLNPIQSLQQVFPVHGQPSIYARTMVALLKARGFRFNTEKTTDTEVTVTGRSPAGETETSTWTIERAHRAGYTSNKKYETDPQAMLYAKACAEVCRKLAPDVLLGISHTREDLELEPRTPVRVQSERVTADELLRESTAPTEPAPAPKVQQWQAPAGTASNEVEKQDTVQVDDPQDDSTSIGSTRIQQRHISKQLEEIGASERQQKLAYLSAFFERQIRTVAELSHREADEVIAELDRQAAAVAVEQAEDDGAADSVQQAIEVDQ